MSSRVLAWIASVLLACALVAGGAGCENRVTLDSYNMISEGMTLDEVEVVLGGPGTEVVSRGIGISTGGVMTTSRQGNKDVRRIYTWKQGRAEITITFVDNKVFEKFKQGL